MAPTIYKLKSGNTISNLVQGDYGVEYRDAIPGNTYNAKLSYVMKLNNITYESARRLPVGFEVKLNESAPSSTSSSSGTTAVNTNKVVITNLGLQCESETGRDFFADWTWFRHGKETKGYKVRWEWDDPDSSSPNGYITRSQEFDNVTDTWHTFTIPEQYQEAANWVQVFITPIANTYKSGDNDVHYWTEDEGEKYKSGRQYYFSSNPPRKPNTKPSITINKETLMLTATIEVNARELDAWGVAFNVVQDNSVSLGWSNPVKINNEVSNVVTFQFPVTAGHTYTVRARTTNEANTLPSGWTDFSNEEKTQPSAPSGLTARHDREKDASGDYKHSVFLEWTPVSNADNYIIEYTNTKSDFDIIDGNSTTGTSESFKTHTTTTSTPSTRIGIDIGSTGYAYYFRVKAKNEEGESTPSSPVTLALGEIPGPPTTWSTSNSAFVGETTYRYVEINGESVQIVDKTPMELNWIHCPKDNSKQTCAQIALNINDNGWEELETMDNETNANDTEEKIHKYTYGTAVSYKGELRFKMDTNHYALKNTKIQWKVRTSGVTKGFSDEGWSIERTIYIYDKPNLELSMSHDPSGIDIGKNEPTHTFSSFPFYFRGRLSLNQEDYTVQRPVGYHVHITSKDYYVTVDDIGRTKTINPGDSVYSKYFDTSKNPLVVQLSADNIDLESNVDYVVHCTANMSTGLAVTNSYEFNVNWVDVEYAINADVSIDKNSYTATITPYCREKVPAGPGGKNLLNLSKNTTFRNCAYDPSINGITCNIDNSYYSAIVCTSLNEYLLNNLGRAFTFSIETLDTSKRLSIIIEGSRLDGSTYQEVDVSEGTQVTIIVAEDFTEISKINFRVNRSLTQFTDMESTYTNLQFELGSEATEYEEYYETYEDGDLVENVTLAVYRREYDGTYKEIASGIPNNYTAVTDPHPALDYARYRFTATDKRTGALSYWDMAGIPVNGGAVIIQWDEAWSTFDLGESTTIEGPSWTGSLLRLPYNIKTTDNRKRDKTLVNYAGREHPVSYYGTHLSESSKWSVDIPAYDKETIYALRRLSLWAGDVYVREPSGTGFWANVEVSFNQSYDDLKIPITFNVTRVEGGV